MEQERPLSCPRSRYSRVRYVMSVLSSSFVSSRLRQTSGGRPLDVRWTLVRVPMGAFSCFAFLVLLALGDKLAAVVGPVMKMAVWVEEAALLERGSES